MARFKVYENPANGYQEKVKDGFNWWVLIFGPLWYLFNGMALQGLAWVLVAFVAGFFTLGIGGLVVWIIAGAKANTEKEKKYLRDGWKFIGYDSDIIQELQVK